MSNSSDSNRSFKEKTMATVTINFSGATTGVVFNPAVTTSVAAFLNANPTVPISRSATGITADNLTSLGLLSAGGDTVWRITNQGVEDNAATLVRVGAGFSASPVLPANSFTFVRAGAPGTYKLTIPGPGGDTFTKASGPQIVSAIQALAINDTYNITGSDYGDTLFGGQNTDTLIGGLGNDSLNGQQQNDRLDGGDGNDTLIGGGQNDTLIGGAGNDTLTGGNQNDRFQYNSPSEGIDTITDFSTTATNSDSIVVSATGFGGGLTGSATGTALSATQFLSGAGVTSAATAAQRFVYNTTNGGLWFDVDGVGGAASVQFATLASSPVPALTASRILVIL